MMEESLKMKRFNHPNVISLIGVCIDAGPAPYIIMPFMGKGSLLFYLKKHRTELMPSDTADEDVVSCVQFVMCVCVCSHIPRTYPAFHHLWMGCGVHFFHQSIALVA